MRLGDRRCDRRALDYEIKYWTNGKRRHYVNGARFDSAITNLYSSYTSKTAEQQNTQFKPILTQESPLGHQLIPIPEPTNTMIELSGTTRSRYPRQHPPPQLCSSCCSISSYSQLLRRWPTPFTTRLVFTIEKMKSFFPIRNLLSRLCGGWLILKYSSTSVVQ